MKWKILSAELLEFVSSILQHVFDFIQGWSKVTEYFDLTKEELRNKTKSTSKQKMKIQCLWLYFFTSQILIPACPKKACLKKKMLEKKLMKFWTDKNFTIHNDHQCLYLKLTNFNNHKYFFIYPKLRHIADGFKCFWRRNTGEYSHQ